jgi:Cu2+-exporting ATPase
MERVSNVILICYRWRYVIRWPKKLSTFETEKKFGEHPVVALVSKTDQAYQRFVQQKIDPLLTGSTRQTQLAQLRDDTPALSAPNEQEQKTNRLIALSGVTMGFATIGSYLFPPLLIPTMAMGVYLMLPMYKRTFKSLVQERKVTLDLLASLYLTCFWLAGYYIFAGFAYMLYYMGVKIIYQMEGRSRENLTNLFGQQPRFVWQLVDGVEVQTPLSALQVGDVVVVNAGEPLPVDGVVIEGLGSVDQHKLTGESQPVEKEVGDTVFTSTLLLSGRLFIQVEKAGQNTLTAKIVEILNQTANYQTEAELKGQELADKTVLPNLALSLLALPVVGLRGSVAVLGAGFGMNMRLVSLLSTMNYLTIASRHNILIKDGRALERLKEMDTIVFDKTGTLTLEQPHVAQIHVMQTGLSEADLLTYAATAEYRQPHPIAKAIIGAAEERDLKLPEIEEASYEVGYGISVRVKRKLIRVGSSRFMTQEGLTIPPQIETLQATCQAQGFALVLVAINEQVAGALELHATIRPEASLVIQNLRKRNLSLAIISGDQEEPTQKLASELGIDSYFANTLPENKANLIKQLQEEGRVVGFIGDGINDAIALKQADVSISLLGATTIATDTAQVVLMDQSLNQLDYLLTLAGKFDNTLQTGFITTIVPGVICIGGVFLAGFGIYAAEILFQLGFFSGLGVAMRPLLLEKKGDEKLLLINKEKQL